ncbi:MAG: radical SAM family heme chaperone HemW [Raineya sp.]|jgi:oxygen-independent coproporphyrinogen-3 oxidase|nr:radical SAM family heme chaperone HemW [Raineya sp.]
MSALYIHIPFCKQACFYCDFHFSTNTSLKSELVVAICQEIHFQKDYLKEKHLNSIYFGGGTPSLLSPKELEQIFEAIARHYTWNQDTEITLEANPDDLNITNIQNFKQLGVNRLSIGIQSFNENHLQFLHRVHNSQEAENCVYIAQNQGISNISIDLIYAIPADNHQIWEKDLVKAIELGVSHISAYSLTIEPKTVFGSRSQKGLMPPIDDGFAAEQFQILMDTLQSHHFEHYEISNFAKNGEYSRHNSNYWKDGEYLGIGPSAHSYNHISRQYNISNNSKYIESIGNQIIPCDIETLSWQDRLNDYLLTGLRTQWGCTWERIYQIDTQQIFKNSQQNTFEKYVSQGLLENNLYGFKLTTKGKFFADQIASDLFLV